MKKKIIATLSIVTLLAVTILTGCGGSAKSSNVSMAFCTWTGYAPMFIAEKEGYFKDAGINMTIQVIEDESTYASLLTQGSMQFIATAQDPNIKMFANGAPIRYVLMMDASNGADGLVARDDIKSLDDLKGKSVALDKSASSYYFFLKALEEKSSIKEEDVNVIDMGDTTEAGLAFISGNADAAIMWEPELSEALESVEGAHALVTSADVPGTIMDSLVVNAKFAEENPETVEAVKEAWYKAIDFMKENPSKAYEDMASGFEEVSAEDVEADSKGLIFYGKAENEKFNTSSGDDSVRAISQGMADFWTAKGECKTDDLTEFFGLLK
ncbi:MAG: ABC transporter substrate-binding protein [Lachnospiraceae bacterium]|nr:ABC transporter substrate-binding protein [Lachnospiraceae bacterium]